MWETMRKHIKNELNKTLWRIVWGIKISSIVPTGSNPKMTVKGWTNVTMKKNPTKAVRKIPRTSTFPEVSLLKLWNIRNFGSLSASSMSPWAEQISTRKYVKHKAKTLLRRVSMTINVRLAVRKGVSDDDEGRFDELTWVSKIINGNKTPGVNVTMNS
jgi:hypothetical protein